MEIPGSQMADNNYFAAGVDAAIPLLAFLAFNFNGRFAGVVRKVFAVMLFLCAAAVIFSDSRGGALGLFAIVVVYCLFLSRKKIRDISIALVASVIIAGLLPQSFYDRMATISKVGTAQTESSARERVQLARNTFAAAKEHSAKGVGPGCWIGISKGYTGLDRALEPHNIWLKVWVELGLPGLFLFVIIWIGVITELIIAYRSAHAAGNQWVAKATMFLALSLISFLVTYTFLDHWDSEFLWILLALGSAVCALYRRGELEPEEDDDSCATNRPPLS
jgi:O-antigen ligase